MSYTEELTTQIVAEYSAEPSRETVDKIAARIGKSPRSIIAKLASAGVYKTPVRTTKTGEPIVKKEELVADIERWLNISAETLVKTGKLDLKALHSAIEVLVDA
jgi:hypothetical protein